MTQALRERIVASFKSYEPEMLRKAEGVQTAGEFILFPFMTDFVIDTAVYDTTKKKFVSIMAEVGVGRCIIGPLMNENSGYFDEWKTETISLEAQ